MSRLSDVLQDAGADPNKLSAKTGISHDRLHALARGAEPTMGELRRIAAALKVPITDFGPPTAAEAQADLLFRRASAGKRATKGAVANLSRKMGYSFELVRAKPAQGPWWISHFAPGDDTLEGAEQNAVTFRSLFCNGDQLSPILSLPRVVIDRMEAMLFVVGSDLDGASAYLDGIPFVFVSARFPGRMLFTLAHECGHLVAHHDPSQSFAVIDETTGAVAEASEAGAKGERYANAFASALLMPRTSVGLALKKIREMAKITADEVGDLEIAYIARIFGVSFWAAARRCEDLSLLPRGAAASMNKELSKRYGSAEKRADEAGLPPRPEVEFPPIPRSLLLSAIEKIRAGELSIGRAATILGLSINDLIAANAPTAH